MVLSNYNRKDGAGFEILTLKHPARGKCSTDGNGAHSLGFAKAFHTYTHTHTGGKALFVLLNNGKTLLEVQTGSSLKPSSWFIDQMVNSNGNL